MYFPKLLIVNYVTCCPNMWFYAAYNAPIGDKTAEERQNEDNHIQNFYLRRYIVGYTVVNHI